MKHTLKVLLLVAMGIFSTLLSISQDSVSISDFRYPETKAIDWKGGLSGGWGSARSEDSEGFSNRIVREASQSDKQGRVGINTSFLFFHAMEGHIQSLQTNVIFSYDHSNSQGTFNEDDVNTYRHSSWRHDLKDIGGNLLWEYQHFPFETDIHFIGSADASYHYSFRKENNDERRSYGPSSTEEIRQFSELVGEAVIGIGYGRMRDGSFVVRALRIIERLTDDGIILRQLTHNEILELVNRVAHVREYTTNYEKFEKFLVRDIVEELEKIGAVSPQLMESFSAFRIAEAFKETVEPRFFGWRIYYAFGQSFLQDLDESLISSGSNYHYFNKDQHYIHRIAAEVGYPISLSTHSLSDFKCDVPAINSSTQFSISSNTSLSYQPGERIDLVGRYEFDRRVSSARFANPYPRIITHKVSGNLRCYVEDLVTMTFSVQYTNQSSQTLYNDPTTPALNGSRSSILFLLGINYNII